MKDKTEDRSHFATKVKLITNLYTLAETGRKRAILCDICQEFKLVLKIAELALQVQQAERDS